jgi:hypothetical protein
MKARYLSRLSRTLSAVRRWLRHTWMSRLPLSGPGRNRWEECPRRPGGRALAAPSYRPALALLEDRLGPNDPFGLGAVALLGPAAFFMSPMQVLLHGWTAGGLAVVDAEAADAGRGRAVATSFGSGDTGPASARAPQTAADSPRTVVSSQSGPAPGASDPGRPASGPEVGDPFANDPFAGLASALPSALPPAPPGGAADAGGRAGGGQADGAAGTGDALGDGVTPFASPGLAPPAPAGQSSGPAALDPATLGGLLAAGASPGASLPRAGAIGAHRGAAHPGRHPHVHHPALGGHQGTVLAAATPGVAAVPAVASPPGAGLQPGSAPTGAAAPADPGPAAPAAPVLEVVRAFGPAGHGRLLLQGTLARVAPLGSTAQIDFFGRGPGGAGQARLLGSTTVTQTVPLTEIDVTFSLKTGRGKASSPSAGVPAEWEAACPTTCPSARRSRPGWRLWRKRPPGRGPPHRRRHRRRRPNLRRPGGRPRPTAPREPSPLGSATRRLRVRPRPSQPEPSE